MSELLYLILPESSSCSSPTISLAKKDVLDSNYVGSFITEIKNIMWIYDIEDFCILYDSNNINAFLSFFDLEEKGEFYNTRNRLRRLFSNSVYKQCALDISEVDRMTITVLDEEQRVCNIFYDVIKEKCKGRVVGILHKQSFKEQTTDIQLCYQNKSEKISVLPLSISIINSWFAENRTPNRLYEWNSKHGENGRGQHSSQKGRGAVSVLLSDRNYPKELVGKAYGQTKYAKSDPKNNLYFYDTQHGAYLRFVPGGAQPHTYHAFHIEYKELPNEIKSKYKIINQEIS